MQHDTGSDASSGDLHARPQKLRWVCSICAIAFVIIFTIIATALRGETEGGGIFSTGDQIAMIGLGLLFGAGIMMFTRPRVVADTQGVKVRNLLASYDLSWDLIEHVSFDDRSPWVTLELRDDDVIPVMAIQAADKEYAVTAVRKLRALHEVSKDAQRSVRN